MSCILLPSQARRRRTLPPHGYEGRRAEPLPVPAPVELPPLPSDEAMAAAAVRPREVGPPVRRLWCETGHLTGLLDSRDEVYFDSLDEVIDRCYTRALDNFNDGIIPDNP